MKRRIVLLLLVTCSVIAFAQTDTDAKKTQTNTAENLLSGNHGLAIGGYGEVHYNQPINKNKYDLGTLDLHRLVIFAGYNFSKNTQFVSEIEFEYAKELWVEQAFLQHKLNKYINLKAGLMLVPMGIVNEYHEPTTFNGVERPIIDNKIAPSTWREIGVGISGTIAPAYIKYQLYVVNGLSGYETAGIFSGSKTLREGRLKGSKAYVSSPALTGKVEFYGISNLTLGLSGYAGKSGSKLLANIDPNDQAAAQKADSSMVGISMLGADARFQTKGIKLTGQFYFTAISNTEQYNKFTAKGTVINDLGSAMIGYYAEAGYNVFQSVEAIKTELMPFVRYEAYNTHQQVAGGLAKNKSYNNTVITTGLTCTLVKGAVLKTDLQFTKSELDTEYTKIFNAGIGVMF